MVRLESSVAPRILTLPDNWMTESATLTEVRPDTDKVLIRKVVSTCHSKVSRNSDAKRLTCYDVHTMSLSCLVSVPLLVASSFCDVRHVRVSDAVAHLPYTDYTPPPSIPPALFDIHTETT